MIQGGWGVRCVWGGGETGLVRGLEKVMVGTIDLGLVDSHTKAALLGKSFPSLGSSWPWEG